MIVDIKDIDHLYDEIKLEYSYIIQKYRLISKKLKKVYKSGKVYQNVRHSVSYTCPNGRNKWLLYFDIEKGKSLDKIAFFPICRIEHNGKSYYVNFNMDSPKAIPQHFLRIYSAHFISRFKERKEFTDLNTEDALAFFHYDGGTYVYNFWDKEQEEMRLINFHGFSIGRYLNKGNVMYFDTFVTKEMLKDDQKLWVKDLLSDSIVNYKLHNPSEDKKTLESRMTRILSLYPTWHEFIDEIELLKSSLFPTLSQDVFDRTILPEANKVFSSNCNKQNR